VQFLKRLLLVHGRWNYNRMSVVVCYMFYKNIAFVLTQFWYQIYTGWSGQKFTVELATQTFNLVRAVNASALLS
jgi:P-type E1-E2 ATPase